MHVHVVDPSAYTPPYDHALCAALAQAGARVELITSRFAYGDVARPEGYTRRELFYRLPRGPTAAAGSRRRRLAKLVQHLPDMLRYRRVARAADVVHFQWLPVQYLDPYLLPQGTPLVLTAHDVLPREPRRGQRAAQARLYTRFDAVVAHSEHGRRRLTDELGVDPDRVHVIPHGVLTPGSPSAGDEPELPVELRGSTRPVVLCFGLIRPYKGIDVLLEAWNGIHDAELWVVGMARMDVAPLRAATAGNVRFVDRFVSDAEVAALFGRAQIAVLPYREIDQSGVLFTALGFATPLVLTAVGGFPELAQTGAARLVAPEDPTALREALRELLADPPARERLSRAARVAAAGPYGWEAIARQTLALYESLAPG